MSSWVLFLKSSAFGTLLILCKLGKETRREWRELPLASRLRAPVSSRGLREGRDGSQFLLRLSFYIFFTSVELLVIKRYVLKALISIQGSCKLPRIDVKVVCSSSMIHIVYDSG